jgi:hypothetical protein
VASTSALVFGFVAAEPVSLSDTLADAGKISGYAVYRKAEGEEPACGAGAAPADVHGRMALVESGNAQPRCLGSYSFADCATQSTSLFDSLLREFDPERPVAALRRAVEEAIDAAAFRTLNFLLSDGERLYAYRLGAFGLHWLARPGQLLVASERLTEERWHEVRQDVLLVCDPRDPVEPHAERLVGDAVVARARIDDLSTAGA